MSAVRHHVPRPLGLPRQSLDVLPTESQGEAGLVRFALERFTVADFVQWYRENRLVLNPDFQRRSVWTPDARSYLIDTMLRGLPMPKVYLRTKVDVRTQVAVRDVVDGQQRLRAILDFAADGLVLNKRAGHYQGMKYSDLEPELQQAFLAYPIGVEHLINGEDSFVLEVFARINTYTVPLNAAEKRNARYQTELKWLIHELSNQLRAFLEQFGIVSTKGMLRMDDDAFFAEMVNIVLRGVGDGGAAALDSLYYYSDS